MSFRKRNVGLVNPSPTSNLSGSTSSNAPLSSTQAASQIRGVRPSPLDGRPTTSTGTQTLDDLLAGHAGFPLGNSILIEESGTTDFAGALLRFYAAEGVVQGHKVHVVGVGEQWGRELPGVTGEVGGNGEKEAGVVVDKEKMKIAWRYERLGEFGAGSSTRGGIAPTPHLACYVHSSMPYPNNFGATMLSQC
jgi:elongator complex protein 4